MMLVCTPAVALKTVLMEKANISLNDHAYLSSETMPFLEIGPQAVFALMT
jgi:hypothetical protein